MDRQSWWRAARPCGCQRSDPNHHQ